MEGSLIPARTGAVWKRAIPKIVKMRPTEGESEETILSLVAGGVSHRMSYYRMVKLGSIGGRQGVFHPSGLG